VLNVPASLRGRVGLWGIFPVPRESGEGLDPSVALLLNKIATMRMPEQLLL